MNPFVEGSLYLIEIPHQTTTCTAALRILPLLYLIEIPHQTTTNTASYAPGFWLYLIEIPHQTTTMYRLQRKQAALYLIEIPHQTTTMNSLMNLSWSCILSKFHIKPQLAHPYGILRQELYLIEIPHQTTTVNRFGGTVQRCILSKFHIKPQRSGSNPICLTVVSYRNSTSNHNSGSAIILAIPLYLIEIPHQTTTNHQKYVSAL